MIEEEDLFASNFKKLKFDDCCTENNSEEIRYQDKIIGTCANSKKSVFLGQRCGLFYTVANNLAKETRRYLKYPNEIEFSRESVESIESWLFYNAKEVNFY